MLKRSACTVRGLIAAAALAAARESGSTGELAVIVIASMPAINPGADSTHTRHQDGVPKDTPLRAAIRPPIQFTPV